MYFYMRLCLVMPKSGTNRRSRLPRGFLALVRRMKRSTGRYSALFGAELASCFMEKMNMTVPVRYLYEGLKGSGNRAGAEQG